MIAGIGTDIVEIDRIGKAVKKESFRAKCYTPREVELCGTADARYADNFAVKEAVAKALGTGFSGFGPAEIEVLRDERGKPYVQLTGGAMERAKELNIGRIHVSISNTAALSFAAAVAEADAI